VKLTDFGLAKLPADMRLTQTGALLGSLYYMSPEQVRAEPRIDQRSDVYSMGAALYEMVTGSKPFDGDSAFAIMSAQVGQDPPPPRTVNPALPEALSDIILKALAKDPDQRFQSAAQFRIGLESVRPAEVKRTAAPIALRWGIGAAAMFLAAFLSISHYRETPVLSVPVSVPAAPQSAKDSEQRRPKPEPIPPKPPRIAASAAVWAVALSPSGKWLAAGTEDRTIEIWNAVTGEKQCTLRGHAAGVTAVSFSPDEQSLVSGDANRTVKVWNLRAKSQRNSFRAGGLVTAVAMSGDRGWLAIASSDRRVKFWNLKQDRESGGFREKREPSALAFSPDGSLIAVAAADGLKLRRVNNGREVQSFDRPGAGALTFTQDGNCLALSATQRGVKLWDTARSRELADIASSIPIRALAVSQAGTTAAMVTEGKVISIWSARQGHSGTDR
jgi:WD40 repeat protein